MKTIMPATVFLVCALSGMAQELRTAGTLLVDISAEALTADDGAPVTQWANAGTLGGSFSALTGNAGATFTNAILGKKAVVFSGTAQSVLTNGTAPAALTGTNPWTVEAWVWTPSLRPSSSVYLSWTQDRGGGSYEEKIRMMLRYDAAVTAVDHKGCSVSFGYGVPAAGAWHHIVATHSALNPERLYVDGNLSSATSEDIKLETGKPLALGGVRQLNTAEYTNFFSGALSRIRIHTGTLSEVDVRHNYLAEAGSYNAANSTVWTGGAGNWNDAAYWTNGAVGGPGKAVSILSGAVGVTNNVTSGPLAALDIAAGTVGLSDNNSLLDTKPPFALGRNAGNAATLNLNRGSMTVSSGTGAAVVDMGMAGAASALTVGGAGGAAALKASRIRVFSDGSAAIQILSNGVLELDGVLADAVTNVSVNAAGGTLRNKTGSTMGFLHNVPQVTIAAGGLALDAVTNSTMSVASVLAHDPAGPATDGGLRKTGAGTLVLSGTNTYTGETAVESGLLVLAPRLLDGLVYRLDASSNALSTLQFDGTGSNVVAWADASGSGILFTTNKTEKCPVYDPALFGGRGGVRFSRNSTSYRLVADRSSRVQSVFAVFSAATGNDIGGFWGQTEGDYGIRFKETSVQYNGNGNDFASSGWMYVNGADGSAFTVGQPAVLTAISGAAQTWRTAIGDYWASATYHRVYKGDIAEILVYDRRLDDLERNAVEQYLMAKWLGTVPAPQLSPSVLPSNSVLRIRYGASVDLGGSSARLSALSGVGVVGNRSASLSTLTIGGLDASSVYAGAITGNVTVIKTGSGRVTLSGPNTFTGATAVEAGTLTLATGVTSVTGLVYRLDASRTNTFTTLADGSNVTVWADAEGSGFTFATTNDLNCPVYDRTLFSGRGGLRFGFNGARGRMIGSAVTNAQTIFAVNMIRDVSNDNGGFWGKNGEDSGLRIGNTTWYYPGNANDFHYGGLVCINGVESNASVTVGIPHLVTSVNSARQTFKPAIGDYWGSSQWISRYYRGEVAEILVYDRKLTDVERQTVEAALMAKWFPASGGAVLPQTAAVSVAAGATLDLAGGAVTVAALSGSGAVSNGLLTVTGDVAPDGTLSLPAAPSLTGSLTLDVGGDGSCDRLAVSGALDVSGLTLLLNLPGSAPSANSYTLVTAPGGVSGPFESASPGGAWKLVYEATSIRLVYFSGTLIQVR